MKQTGFKRTNSILKSYKPLRAKKGFKVTSSQLKPGNIIRTQSGLKRTGFKRIIELTPKKKLDNIISNVIRLGSADDQGMVRCATCPAIIHYKMIQCGHFQKRGNMATRYDMRNLAPQCESCNCFKDGMEDEHAAFIDAFYGPGTADELEQKAHTIEHYYPFDQEIIKWSAVLKTLVEKHSGEIQY